MAKRTIQNKWAQNSSNVQTFTETEIASGIEYKGAVVSNQLNGVASDLYNYTDNLQRAGTAWNPLKSYEVGDVVEVRAVLNNSQLIAKFACIVAGRGSPLVDNGATSFILDSDKNVCIFTIVDDGTKTLKVYCGSSWVLLTSSGFYARDIIDVIYPVGSIYISLSSAFDPNNVWLGTAWNKLKNGIFLEATDGIVTEHIDETDPANPVTTYTGKAVETETLPGLPNLTGGASRLAGASLPGTYEGALYYKGEEVVAFGFVGNASGAAIERLFFDASKSSPIYKNDVNCVQPHSIAAIMWQRIS